MEKRYFKHHTQATQTIMLTPVFIVAFIFVLRYYISLQNKSSNTGYAMLIIMIFIFAALVLSAIDTVKKGYMDRVAIGMYGITNIDFFKKSFIEWADVSAIKNTTSGRLVFSTPQLEKNILIIGKDKSDEMVKIYI